MEMQGVRTDIVVLDSRIDEGAIGTTNPNKRIKLEVSGAIGYSVEVHEGTIKIDDKIEIKPTIDSSTGDVFPAIRSSELAYPYYHQNDLFFTQITATYRVILIKNMPIIPIKE